MLFLCTTRYDELFHSFILIIIINLADARTLYRIFNERVANGLIECPTDFDFIGTVGSVFNTFYHHFTRGKCIYQ